jgi:hypothetical protein
MATFYLLPPRACLEQSLGELLGRLLPGLPLPADAWDGLAERLTQSAGWPADVYLVPRDDLPEGEPVADALAAAFGAEPGDRVIEIGAGRAARVWEVGPGGVPAVVPAR